MHSHKWRNECEQRWFCRFPTMARCLRPRRRSQSSKPAIRAGGRMKMDCAVDMTSNGWIGRYNWPCCCRRWRDEPQIREPISGGFYNTTKHPLTAPLSPSGQTYGSGNGNASTGWCVGGGGPVFWAYWSPLRMAIPFFIWYRYYWCCSCCCL